jgi:hypothetical protein
VDKMLERAKETTRYTKHHDDCERVGIRATHFIEDKGEI